METKSLQPIVDEIVELLIEREISMNDLDLIVTGINHSMRNKKLSDYSSPSSTN
ncbi:hypothetical protein [Levilactobacillus bambusae]|uniref:hypothetical protein n=1 Tax=Levilactobacillus bambusae TaxID=2024736 RepID=UPI001403AD8D|nr:hypothetical protein [Levilactobacillus bambusae]